MELIWIIYDLSRKLQFSKFVWTLRSSVWVELNHFLLIDAKDKSKISSDQKRLFIALSLYPLSLFANTPFKGRDRLDMKQQKMQYWREQLLDSFHINETNGGRQAAISHNIFSFHATDKLLCLPDSHKLQPFGLPCHSMRFSPQLLRFQIVNLVHWHCNFLKSSHVMQKIYKMNKDIYI